MLFTDGATLVIIALTFIAGALGFFLSHSTGPRRSSSSQLKLLRRVPFLAPLTDSQLEKIIRLVREVRVPADVYVIREFRAGEAMYILVSGTLHILKRGAVDETLIQIKGPGEVVGEMALLTGGRRIASVKSVSPCLLLQIDRDDFEEFLAMQPEINRAVWAACEVHSINLVLADTEKTRSLSLEKRLKWIAERESKFIHSGELLTIKEAGFVVLVAGSIEHLGKNLVSPALIVVRPGEEIKTLESGRICILKSLPINGFGFSLNHPTKAVS